MEFYQQTRAVFPKPLEPTIIMSFPIPVFYCEHFTLCSNLPLRYYWHEKFIGEDLVAPALLTTSTRYVRFSPEVTSTTSV